MLLNPQSRQHQILSLLLNQRSGLSIDAMAAQLDISRNAVKQHLVELEKLNWVQTAELSSTGGRPARIYALTDQGLHCFPKQYAWFGNLLLDQLCEDMDTPQLEQQLWRLGEKLAQSLAPQLAGKTELQKQEAVIGIMQALGYEAQLLHDGPQTQIKAINCVFHDLAQKHPAICEFDRALLSTALASEVEQTACMAKADCECRFRLRKSD
jgi:DeoR family transcriptional regulator, suf operon transcriptional repressor